MSDERPTERDADTGGEAAERFVARRPRARARREAAQRIRARQTRPKWRAAASAARKADDHRGGEPKARAAQPLVIPLPCRAAAACEEADEHRLWVGCRGKPSGVRRIFARILSYAPARHLRAKAHRSERRRAEARRRGCIHFRRSGLRAALVRAR